MCFTNWLIYSYYHCYIGNKPILTSLRNSIWRASHGNITQLVEDIIQGMKKWKWENNFFIWIDSNHKTWINCWILNTFNQTFDPRLFHKKMFKTALNFKWDRYLIHIILQFISLIIESMSRKTNSMQRVWKIFICFIIKVHFTIVRRIFTLIR